mmetsp:Transcript_8759/g.8065  ORF Transcript_8759/g.8065 Transcript_8759/m.8065 type:complete len:352 (+) Transcript_8759:902-1957(+)
MNSVDYCTYCDDSLGYLFYNYTCVPDQCPEGFTRMNATKNVCVRDGLVCDYGYDFNDFGECVLAVAQCEKGYVLNRTKDQCIPKPLFYFPFLFLMLALGYTIYSVVVFRKDPGMPLHSKLARLLLGYILLQTAQYLILLILSLVLRYSIITTGHCLSVVSMYLSNLVGFFYFKKYTKKNDPAFAHWIQNNRRIYKMYSFVALGVNFKLLRGIYSKASKRPEFNAPFSEEYEHMVRPLFVQTLLNALFQVIPVIFIDLYTLMVIPWGYQIMMSSVDNIVLAVAIFILEIIEFKLHKQLYIQGGGMGELANLGEYQEVKKEPEFSNVMSGIVDDDIKGFKHLDQTNDFLVPPL